MPKSKKLSSLLSLSLTILSAIPMAGGAEIKGGKLWMNPGESEDRSQSNQFVTVIARSNGSVQVFYHDPNSDKLVQKEVAPGSFIKISYWDMKGNSRTQVIRGKGAAAKEDTSSDETPVPVARKTGSEGNSAGGMKAAPTTPVSAAPINTVEETKAVPSSPASPTNTMEEAKAVPSTSALATSSASNAVEEAKTIPSTPVLATPVNTLEEAKAVPAVPAPTAVASNASRSNSAPPTPAGAWEEAKPASSTPAAVASNALDTARPPIASPAGSGGDDFDTDGSSAPVALSTPAATAEQTPAAAVDMKPISIVPSVTPQASSAPAQAPAAVDMKPIPIVPSVTPQASSSSQQKPAAADMTPLAVVPSTPSSPVDMTPLPIVPSTPSGPIDMKPLSIVPSVPSSAVPSTTTTPTPKTSKPLPTGENFISTVNTSLGPCIWKEFPIKVFMPHASVSYGPQLEADVKWGFETWSKASDGKLSFQFVGSAKEADMVLSWTASKQNLINKTESGEATADYSTSGTGKRTVKNPGDINHAKITFVLVDINNKPWEPGALRSVALHEIGHAIGLFGHSQNAGDIMYFQKTSVSELSERDINTLLVLYQSI